MPTLPDYTVMGPRPVSTVAATPAQDTSGQILAQGLSAVGQAATGAADQIFTQRTNLARAKAANGSLDHQIAVESATNDLIRKVQTVDVPYDQAKQQWQDTVSKIPAPEVQYLDPIGQENLKKAIQRNIFTQSVRVNEAVFHAQKADFKDQFADNLDKLGKLAGMPDADIDAINAKAEAFAPLGRAAGLPPKQVDKAIQDFKDQNWFNNAQQAAMESKNSMPHLKQLEHDLTDADGFYAGKLDTNKRNIVLRSVINDRLILENRLQHEQDKREMKAIGVMNQINQQISSGIPATPVMWNTWSAQVKGTQMAEPFKEAQDDENQIQNVLRQPMADQIKYVQDKQAALMQNGGSLREASNLARLSTAVNKNVNLMRTEPLLFATNRTGEQIPAMDFSQLSSQDGQHQLGAQIADRMATLQTLRKQYGSQIQMRPLLPQEAQQLASTLDQAKPQDRLGVLTTLRNSFNDDRAYEAAMAQVSPHRPVLATAGTMLGHSSPSQIPVWFDAQQAPKDQDIQRIIEGEAFLNPPAGDKPEKGGLKTTVLMPPNEDNQKSPGLQTAFAKAAGNLFQNRPQLANLYFDIYKSAYAGIIGRSGDMSGILNTQASKKALQIALGNTIDYNGQRVSVPAGMDPSRFKGLVANAVASLAPTKDWASRMSGYGLIEKQGVGDGVYQLTLGNQAVTHPDGSDFVIDLRNQYLPGVAHGSPEDIARRKQMFQ